MTLRRRRARPLFGIVAVVQVILLLTSVMVIPARVIAQDVPRPRRRRPRRPPFRRTRSTRPMQPSPQGTARKHPIARYRTEDPTHPISEAEAEQEPAWVLRIHPRVVTLDSGASRRVRAFRCDEGAGGFGRNRKPATEDDSCSPVKVAWSEKETDLLALSRETGRRVRVTAGASTGDSLLVAKRDGEKAEAAVRVKASKASSAEVAATGDSERAEGTLQRLTSPTAKRSPRKRQPSRVRRSPDHGPRRSESALSPTSRTSPRRSRKPSRSPSPRSSPPLRPSPSRTPHPRSSPEPRSDREPTAPAEPEPTVEPEPTAAAEPAPIVEPNAEPEPTAAAEPEPSVEPSVEPQPTAAPTFEPAPSAAAEPTPESEPAATAEPSVEHELAAELFAGSVRRARALRRGRPVPCARSGGICGARHGSPVWHPTRARAQRPVSAPSSRRRRARAPPLRSLLRTPPHQPS